MMRIRTAAIPKHYIIAYKLETNKTAHTCSQNMQLPRQVLHTKEIVILPARHKTSYKHPINLNKNETKPFVTELLALLNRMFLILITDEGLMFKFHY